VKRQVDGAEEIGEPFGPRSFIGHATRVPADRSIVNPDGSAESARFWLTLTRPGPVSAWCPDREVPSGGWLRQARRLNKVNG
jgi:hypothetical protein